MLKACMLTCVACSNGLKPHTILVTIKRKEVIPDVKRKHESNQKIKRTFARGACHQAECGAADNLKMGVWIIGSGF